MQQDKKTLDWILRTRQEIAPKILPILSILTSLLHYCCLLIKKKGPGDINHRRRYILLQ